MFQRIFDWLNRILPPAPIIENNDHEVTIITDPIQGDGSLPAAAEMPMPPAHSNVQTLAWGQRVSAEFRKRVFDICRTFQWTDDHANWLMACIAFETGQSFDPAIKNQAGSGATGLIQFMPRTARGLGTTTGALAQMTAVQQLEFVEKYFRPYHKRIHSLPDMYMAILMPKYVGKEPHAVLFSEGIAYRQNSGLDVNRDGKVTKEEAAGKVQQRLVTGLLSENRSREVV